MKPTHFKAWTAWGIGVIFVVLVFGFQTGYAFTKGFVADTHHLNASQIGFIGTAYTWAFAIFQLASGSLLDRVGARRVLPIAIITMALGVFGFSTLGSYPLLVLSQVLVAAGACFGFVGAGFIGGAWFGMARYGLMFALVQFIASISASVNQRVFDVALQRWSWNQLLLTMSVSIILLFLIALVFLKDPDGWDKTHGWPDSGREFANNVRQDLSTTLGKPRMWVVLILGATSFAGLLAVGSVWGGDIAQLSGLSESDAGAALPWAWVGLAIGAPIFAAVSNRSHNRRFFLIGSVAAQAVIILFAIVAGPPNVMAFALIFLGFGLASGGSMIAFTMAAELAGTKLAGTSASLVNGIQFLGAGLLMFLPGYLQENFNVTVLVSFTVIPTLLGVSLLVGFLLPETYQHDVEEMGPEKAAVPS